MSKPVVLIIPGSYVLVSEYQPLIDTITQAGYEAKGIHPPTVGPRSQEGQPYAAPSMYDDAAKIAKEVEILADRGKDVVLIGHSYAGIPMSQCTEGLSRTERQKGGKPGGIVHLGYIAALAPALGQSAKDLTQQSQEAPSPSMEIDEYGWLLLTDPKQTATFVCQDLPVAEGEALVRRFAKHSARCFADELTHVGYIDIPSSWLLTQNDGTVPPALQRAMIDVIEQSSGRTVHVTNLESGHCPNVSHEHDTNQWVLDVLRQLEMPKET